jgi:hypothetical protein
MLSLRIAVDAPLTLTRTSACWTVASLASPLVLRAPTVPSGDCTLSIIAQAPASEAALAPYDAERFLAPTVFEACGF